MSGAGSVGAIATPAGKWCLHLPFFTLRRSAPHLSALHWSGVITPAAAVQRADSTGSGMTSLIR
eukprot:2877449-Amphidinium_carterae.1